MLNLHSTPTLTPAAGQPARARRAWRGLRGLLCAALLGLPAAMPAHAAYPERPINLIVPFAPGGSSDTIARTLGPRLSEVLGQTLVIENVSGAGGVLGTQKAVRAPADGYTVLLGSGSEVLINKLINPKGVAYDGLRDLIPVIFVGTGPMVLVGRPGLEANNITDLLKLLRQKPDGYSFASAGNGTPMHVAGELLNMRANLSMTHVPYRGAAPALVDIMGNQVDLGVSTLIAAQPHIQSGKIHAYALTSAAPSELAPGMPALGQQPGLEGFDLGVWFGLFVPAGTPAAVVERLQTVAGQVLKEAPIRERLASQGISASGESAEVLKTYMDQQVKIYSEVVKAAGLTAK